MITIKLAIAIIAFILSSGQIVFQSFQHHHAVNPRHGAIKFVVFIVSSLSLVYLAKDIYADFESEKMATVASTPIATQAELDYWHNVYRNPSPEGYCAYLEKFPEGQFISIAKNGIPGGDCFQVKQQAETETMKKNAAEAALLKEKLDNETKALAEKNAQLEQEAKNNAERIAALETLAQVKTAAELKTQPELNPETKIEAELKAKFESDINLPQPEVEQTKHPVDTEIKTKLETDEPLF